MIEPKKYYEILAAKDNYTTPAGLHSKNIFGTSLSFYARVLKVVLYANRWARKGIYDDFKWVYSSLDLLHGFERSGMKISIEGMNNLSATDKPVIIISNHMSTLETLALPGIIHPVKNIVFVTKQELTDYPVFGPINSERNPIIVGRKNPREDLKLVMEEGAERINSGNSVVLFPQRTRSKYFDTKNFNTLGVKLAKQNDVSIIPMALLTDAWDNGKMIKEIGKIDISKTVHFAFGKPFKVDGRGNEEHQLVIDFITQKLKEWGREDYIIK